jgi:hypothetical protein
LALVGIDPLPASPFQGRAIAFGRV